MPNVDARTTNRNYRKTAVGNTGAYDLERLGQAMDQIDADMANVMSDVSGKASTAALGGYQPVSEKGAPLGYAPLDTNSDVPETNLPQRIINAVDSYEAGRGPQTMRIAIIGDLQPDMTPATGPNDHVAKTEQLMAFVASKKPHKIVVGGDITNRRVPLASEGGANWLMPNYQSAKRVQLAEYRDEDIMEGDGNHDVSYALTSDLSTGAEARTMDEALRNRRGGSNYRVLIGNIDLLFMWAENYQVGGNITDETWRWWDRLMAEGDDRYNAITFTHQPIANVHPVNADGTGGLLTEENGVDEVQAGSVRFEETLGRRKNRSAWFYFHCHRGGGDQLRQRVNNYGAGNVPCHFIAAMNGVNTSREVGYDLIATFLDLTEGSTTGWVRKYNIETGALALEFQVTFPFPVRLAHRASIDSRNAWDPRSGLLREPVALVPRVRRNFWDGLKWIAKGMQRVLTLGLEDLDGTDMTAGVGPGIEGFVPGAYSGVRGIKPVNKLAAGMLGIVRRFNSELDGRGLWRLMLHNKPFTYCTHTTSTGTGAAAYPVVDPVTGEVTALLPADNGTSQGYVVGDTVSVLTSDGSGSGASFTPVIANVPPNRNKPARNGAITGYTKVTGGTLYPAPATAADYRTAMDVEPNGVSLYDGTLTAGENGKKSRLSVDFSGTREIFLFRAAGLLTTLGAWFTAYGKGDSVAPGEFHIGSTTSGGAAMTNIKCLPNAAGGGATAIDRLAVDYDSGWVSLGAAAFVTITHNLGTKNLRVVMFKARDPGVPAREFDASCPSPASGYGAAIAFVTNDTIEIASFNTGAFSYDNFSYGGTATNLATAEFRVMLSRIGGVA